jgi:DNA-binding MarR family transcriptional regulator
MMADVSTQAGAEPRRNGEREAVGELIDALRTFTVESDVFVDVFARAHGLGRRDLNAIMWISAGTSSGHPVSSGELATRLGLGAPATTALVDRLEAAGHVRRTRDPHDRRKVTIGMEPKALELAIQFFQPLGRLMSAAVEGTPDEDLRAAAAIVRQLISAVTEARMAADPPG